MLRRHALSGTVDLLRLAEAVAMDVYLRLRPVSDVTFTIDLTARPWPRRRTLRGVA